MPQARRMHSEQAAAFELLGTESGSSSRSSIRHNNGMARHAGAQSSEAVEEARNITEALRRTHGMMGNTLSQAMGAREVGKGASISCS